MMQTQQNPDVNTPIPDAADSEADQPARGGDTRTDIEREDDDETIPVPPDAQPAGPIEEPPGSDGPPVGDVDDSPKRLA